MLQLVFQLQGYKARETICISFLCIIPMTVNGPYSLPVCATYIIFCSAYVLDYFHTVLWYRHFLIFRISVF